MRDRCSEHRAGAVFAAGLVTIVIMLTAADGRAGDQPRKTRPDFATRTLTSDWQISIGGNLTTFETAAAWAPKGLAGAAIDLEDGLGLDEQVGTLVLAVQYRFNRRHSLGLSLTELDRSASRILDEEIEWGDYVFRAEGEVATELDTRVFKLTWRYDFSDMDRLNAGFLAGLSTFDLGATLSGEARLESDTGDEWIEGVVEGASFVAPLPVVGFFLDYAVTPRWVLRFSADVVDLSISTHSGRVLEADFSFEYAVSDLVGIGAGLGGTDIEYRSEKEDETFAIRYRFSYLGAYLTFSF
ncbi:MAG TPA: hypothetical protein VLT32_15105 [Candidatus Sulfomarinibacteraceae bacterium]|nr:hypothetical protein [Candidatus Sulfomarinibacteraceae bacterium]